MHPVPRMASTSKRSTSRVDASISRRVDRRSRDSWTRPLRRMRRAIDSSVRLIHACHRMVVSSERWAGPRPIKATNQLLRVSSRLVEAAEQLMRAGHSLKDTVECLERTPDEHAAGAPGKLIDATARWFDAAKRLDVLSNRVDADIAWLREWVTSLEFLNWPIPDSGWLRSRLASRRAGLARLYRSYATTATEAVRRLHRGRAPPLLDPARSDSSQ
jgi:hypothetical protein